MPAPVNEELLKLCERIVARLMSRYDWRLLDQADFVRILLERAKAEGIRAESDITRIAKNEYATVLHGACSPKKGNSEHRHRHQQAYEELGRYLYDIAYNRRPECPADAQDATQKALLDIYQSLKDNQCRKPGAFLAFSIGKLRGALTWVDRSQRVGGEKPFSLDDDVAMAGEARLREEPSISPEEETERRLLAESVWAELQRKFQKHPRAAQQLEAVILKHAFGCDNQEIATTLGVTSPEAVSSLLSRGKKKLANNQEFQELSTRMLSRWRSG